MNSVTSPLPPFASAQELVEFKLDAQRYAIPLAAVVQVIPMVALTRLPKAPAIVLGAFNLRGLVLPVLDIRQRFRLPARQPSVRDHLLVATTRSRAVALIVDEVLGATSVSPEKITAPEAVSPQLGFLGGVAQLADELVLIHDLDTFLSLEEGAAIDSALAAEKS